MRPSSPAQKTLGYVDTFAKDLATSLAARNLTSIVDVVFVSDHGMTDTSNPEFIYVDDILGEGWNHITHSDGRSLNLVIAYCTLTDHVS